MAEAPDDRRADPAGKNYGDEPMTSAQSARLRRVARQAFEPEAFDPNVTTAEASRRIAALEAKLALQDEPPHTL